MNPALKESPAPTRSITSPDIKVDFIFSGPLTTPSAVMLLYQAPLLTVTPNTRVLFSSLGTLTRK